jgi:hypothetical protein
MIATVPGKSANPKVMFVVAFMLVAQTFLLVLSGMVKPTGGRWVQGLAIGGLLIGIGVMCHALARRAATRQVRIENGLCLNCGYDLRETPERCPECGKIPGPS